MEPFQIAETFHQTFDPRRPAQPQPFSTKEACHRAGFKIEELVEFLYAASNNDRAVFTEAVESLRQAIDLAQEKVVRKQHSVTDPLVDQVDALTDLLYFCYGSFSLMGVDPQPILEIVHQANMQKLFPDGKPHYDPVTNKVLKPADWEEKAAPEPRIKAELKRQRQAKDETV